VTRWWPGSLFARTALLIAGTLTFFALITWAGIVWTTMIPAAEVTAHVLAQRATAAVTAYQAGTPLPEGVELGALPRVPERRHHRELFVSLYLSHLRNRLEKDLPGSEVVLARTAMPTEIWVRPAQVPDRWFVLKWQIARPETPIAMAVIVVFGALVALLGAALFARRLTAPLGALAEATRRVADGERVTVSTASGPSEVRSLAAAFQAMSTRLAELDEQRELMLAGLSHDLRSPLARVRVAVELLDRSDPVLIQQMTVDVEEIDRMVAQFLHYVRAGYRENPVVACLDDVVRDSLSPYQQGGGLRSELNAIEPRLIAVDSVRRVISNLVQNAFEYGQLPVTVRTTLQPRALRISVEDRGPGVSQQNWAEAVRPFHRLRAAPGTGHSGLGLATVERLVRASQGTLEAARIDGGFIVDVTFTAPPPAVDV